MRASTVLVPAIAVVLVGGCSRESSSIGFDKFVNANVQLRRLSEQSTSTSEFDARKRATLARLGVSDADLTDFVKAHSGDVKYMSAAWDSVEARLGRADSAAHGPPPGAVVGPPGKVPPGPLPQGRHDFPPGTPGRKP